MAKTYVALLDNVFIKETKKTRKIGVLDIPDTVDTDYTFGIVVSVGDGTFENGNYVPMCVKPGDEVVFPKTVGASVNFNGDELLLVKSSDIIAVARDTEVIIDEADAIDDTMDNVNNDAIDDSINEM